MEHTTETKGTADSDAVAGLITAFDAVKLAEIIISDGQAEVTRRAEHVLVMELQEIGRKLGGMVAYLGQAKALQDRGRAAGLGV